MKNLWQAITHFIAACLRIVTRVYERIFPFRVKKPATDSNPVYRLDENVLFTVYRPVVISPNTWYPLLAFAHLSEQRPDAPANSPNPQEEVERQAKSILGAQLVEHLETIQQSKYAVPHKGWLTFEPRVEGVEFNPPRQSFFWVKDVHRAEFEMRTSSKHDKRQLVGSLLVRMGSLILADIPLSLRVDSEVASDTSQITLAKECASPWRKIFPSYSHKDTHIIEEFEHFIEAIGDKYLRDVKVLRSGEVWDKRLEELIGEADVFQLFWSSNSMNSEFVRRELECALRIPKLYFVRPVYWEEPLPGESDPELLPSELRKLHFHKISFPQKRKVIVFIDNSVEHTNRPTLLLPLAIMLMLLTAGVWALNHYGFIQVFGPPTPSPTSTPSPSPTGGQVSGLSQEVKQGSEQHKTTTGEFSSAPSTSTREGGSTSPQTSPAGATSSTNQSVPPISTNGQNTAESQPAPPRPNASPDLRIEKMKVEMLTSGEAMPGENAPQGVISVAVRWKIIVTNQSNEPATDVEVEIHFHGTIMVPDQHGEYTPPDLATGEAVYHWRIKSVAGQGQAALDLIVWGPDIAPNPRLLSYKDSTGKVYR